MREAEFQRIAQDTVNHQAARGTECQFPPPGWRCTRGDGHDGPCAAWPTDEEGNLLTFDEYQNRTK